MSILFLWCLGHILTFSKHFDVVIKYFYKICLEYKIFVYVVCKSDVRKILLVMWVASQIRNRCIRSYCTHWINKLGSPKIQLYLITTCAIVNILCMFDKYISMMCCITYLVVMRSYSNNCIVRPRTRLHVEDSEAPMYLQSCFAHLFEHHTSRQKSMTMTWSMMIPSKALGGKSRRHIKS